MISLFPSFLIGYAFGSIPTALLVVQKARGIDVRTVGSGNVGAMNSYLVTRSALIGITVFLLDFLKGLAPVVITRMWLGADLPVEGAAGVGAIVGHNFSIWLNGRGGRGIATAAGAVLTIVPIVIPVWVLCWAIGFAFVREINVSNAVACCLSPLLLIVLPDEIRNMWCESSVPTVPIIVFVAIVMAIILTKLVKPVHEFVHSQRRL